MYHLFWDAPIPAEASPMKRIIEVEVFPCVQSVLMPCAPKPDHISGAKGGSGGYIDIYLLGQVKRKDEVETGQRTTGYMT